MEPSNISSKGGGGAGGRAGCVGRGGGGGGFRHALEPSYISTINACILALIHFNNQERRGGNRRGFRHALEPSNISTTKREGGLKLGGLRHALEHSYISTIKSREAGVHWSPHTFQQSRHALEPSNISTIKSGEGRRGAGKSRDGGQRGQHGV